MLVVILGFVLFRAESLADAWLVISKMFLFTTAPVHTLTLYALLDGWTVFLLLTAALLALGLPQRLCALADVFPRLRVRVFRPYFMRRSFS